MSKLYFKYGTMGSSKTLQLLAMAYNLEENGIQFLTLKPSIDTREEGNIIKSRVGLERECVMINEDDDLYECISKYKQCLETLPTSKLGWVIVDECQFLSEQQIDELARVVDDLDINVMCYGLRTDFKSHLFPASKRLFELADTIEEIKSRCRCGNKTSINARFNSNDEIILDGDQVLIGGNETYKPICRKCFFEKIKDNFNV